LAASEARLAAPAEPRWFPPWLLAGWNRLAPLPAFYLLAVPAATLRAGADDHGFPINDQFAGIERFIFTVEPNRWLQSAFLDFEAVRLIAVGIYFSWFGLKLYAAVPLILGWRRYELWQLVGYTLLAYYLTMGFFWLMPLEPPWMHFTDIPRVQDMVFARTSGSDNNPYAAMPSLHVMLPAMVALWYGLRDPIGKVFLAYSALISVTVVYTGDHYVADIAAGYALAVAMYCAFRWLRLPLFPARESTEESPAQADLRLAA
jgi:hypothetical protein